ncbi:MAG: zinc ribbon domain-containing protein [Methanomassiliicoccales archaeon]|nr:zinc ribbon domain-containing protein [Methanomassiliicoccales archaeon]
MREHRLNRKSPASTISRMKGADEMKKSKRAIRSLSSKEMLHPALMLGIFFNSIGVALILLTFLLPWVEISRPHMVSNLLTVSDLVGRSENYLIMYFLIVISLAVIIFTIAEIVSKFSIRPHTAFLSAASFLSSMICIVLIAISILWITDDFSIGIIPGVKYGAAAFVAVFGSVLVFAGSLILLLGHVGHRHATSTWHSPRLEFSKKRQITSFDVKQAPMEDSVRGKTCVNCGSPLDESWIVCPICGRRQK